MQCYYFFNKSILSCVTIQITLVSQKDRIFKKTLKSSLKNTKINNINSFSAPTFWTNKLLQHILPTLSKGVFRWLRNDRTSLSNLNVSYFKILTAYNSFFFRSEFSYTHTEDPRDKRIQKGPSLFLATISTRSRTLIFICSYACAVMYIFHRSACNYQTIT